MGSSMKITIHINGKKEIAELPTSWEQVSFGKFCDLDDCGNDKVKILSLFTGIDYQTLLDAKIEAFDDIIVNRLSFLSEKPQNTIPDKILGYDLPKRLEFQKTKQYIDLQNYIKESRDLSPKEQLKRYTLYCAVYACVSAYGDYKWEWAENLAPEFFNAPCTEVMGIGNFTLLRLIASKNTTEKTSLHRPTLTQRFKLVLKLWRIRLALASPWSIWKKKLV
jgi:hypothetical protein